MKEIRDRIAEIDRKAGLLLDGLSAETKAFIETKLRDLAVEKDRLQRRIEELASLPTRRSTSTPSCARASRPSGICPS